MTWIALALLVVSAVITAVITPSRQTTKASTLSDIQLPTTSEGTPKAVIFGDCWSGDWTVLWYGDFDTAPIHSSGGKK